MTTQVGNILTIQGHTTPNYDVFTIDMLSSVKKWSYDDAVVNAGNFVVGTAYQIISVGTTDFTLIGADSNTVGHVFVATTSIPAPYGVYPYTIGSGTGTAIVAGITKIAQPLLASGQTGFNYSLPDTANIGGQPQTHGSPNVTQNFIVEILYLMGAGPDGTHTVEYFRQQALTIVNSTFGLALI